MADPLPALPASFVTAAVRQFTIIVIDIRRQIKIIVRIFRHMAVYVGGLDQVSVAVVNVQRFLPGCIEDLCHLSVAVMLVYGNLVLVNIVQAVNPVQGALHQLAGGVVFSRCSRR